MTLRKRTCRGDCSSIAIFSVILGLWSLPLCLSSSKEKSSTVRFELEPVPMTSPHRKQQQTQGRPFLRSTSPRRTSSAKIDGKDSTEISHNQFLRRAADTITTTSCSKARSISSFEARLDLMYLYQIEYSTQGDEQTSNHDRPDFDGIERAVATSLAAALNRCDEHGRPVYAVQISDQQRHKVSPSTCHDQSSSQDKNITCQVIRGITSILLDEGAFEITSAAYKVIDLLLNDVTRVNEFIWTPLTHINFLRSIGENVALLQNSTEKETDNGTTFEESSEEPREEGNGTIVVAIVSVLIAVLFVSFTFFMAWRNWHLFVCLWRKYKLPSPRSVWSNRRMKEDQKLSHWKCKRENNLYFSQLADDSHDRYQDGRSHNPGDDQGVHHHPWMLATLHAMRSVPPGTIPVIEHVPAMDRGINSHNHTNNGAISDLTSDSESIKSSLKMDSIKEENAGDEELILAELAMAEEPVTRCSLTPEGKNSSSRKTGPSSSYSSSPDETVPSNTGRNSNTQPDESEDEVVEFPAFMGAVHYYDQQATGLVLSEVTSCLSHNRSVLEKVGASKPKYYNEDAEIDAHTPVRSNVEKVEDYDALGNGDPQVLDESDEDDMNYNNPMLRTLNGRLTTSGLSGRQKYDHPFPSEPFKSIYCVPEFSGSEVTPETDTATKNDAGELLVYPESGPTFDGNGKEHDRNRAAKAHANGENSVEDDKSDVSFLEGRSHALFDDSHVDYSLESPTSATSMPISDGKGATGESVTVVTNDSVSPVDSDTDDNEFSVTSKANFVTMHQKKTDRTSLRALEEITARVNNSNFHVADPSLISPESRENSKSASSFSNKTTTTLSGKENTCRVNAESHNLAGFLSTLPVENMGNFKSSPDEPNNSRQAKKKLATAAVVSAARSKGVVALREQQKGNHEFPFLAHGSTDMSRELPKVARVSLPGSVDETEDAAEEKTLLPAVKPKLSLSPNYDADDENLVGGSSPETTMSQIASHFYQDEVSERAMSSAHHLSHRVPPSPESNDCSVLTRQKTGVRPNEAGSIEFASETPKHQRCDDLLFSEDADSQHSDERKNDVSASGLTSPEGLRFLEDSSAKNSSRGRVARVKSLQDLRLLGPVVADSTSEDISIVGHTPKEDQSREHLSSSVENENESADSGSETIRLPLPYLVSEIIRQTPRKSNPVMDSSVLSDISSSNDTESPLAEKHIFDVSV